MQKIKLQTDQMYCLGSSREIAGEPGLDLPGSVFGHHPTATLPGLFSSRPDPQTQFLMCILCVKRLKRNKMGQPCAF